MVTKVIAAGNVSDEAQNWLVCHGARIENNLALSLIELPEAALVDRGAYAWEYAISFYDADGNYEETWVEVELAVDAYETRLRLKKS